MIKLTANVIFARQLGAKMHTNKQTHSRAFSSAASLMEQTFSSVRSLIPIAHCSQFVAAQHAGGARQLPAI